MGSHYRWFVFIIFFTFMLLHQADKLLIGPLTTPIMATFSINEAQMGAIFTGALVAQAVFYPLWGYLYDRYARARLLALASWLRCNVFSSSDRSPTNCTPRTPSPITIYLPPKPTRASPIN